MGAKYLFIVNPVANRGRGKELTSAVAKSLHRRGFSFDMEITERPGDGIRLAREQAFSYERIVAAGGDGTVHEVVNGLMQAHRSNHHAKPLAALGIVPIGSGNDFVKMLGIRQQVDHALSVLTDGQIRRIDVGEITVDHLHHRYFNNNVGVGFDAYVNAESMKIVRLKGLAVYLVAAIKSILRYPHPLVRYEVEDRIFEERVLLISTGNGRCSGGGFYLTPEASVDDGKLDVCVIRSMNKMRMFLKIPLVLKGSHGGLSEVSFYRTPRFWVESEAGFPIHADGEVVSAQAHNLEIRVIPSAIQVLGANA